MDPRQPTTCLLLRRWVCDGRAVCSLDSCSSSRRRRGFGATSKIIINFSSRGSDSAAVCYRNNFVRPPSTLSEIRSPHRVLPPVIHVDYAPRVLLRLKRRTDTRPLPYARIASSGQRIYKYTYLVRASFSTAN